MYAHAVIELEDRIFQRGDDVDEADLTPEDYAALIEGGALSDDPYDQASDIVAAPDVVEIDGVRYTKETTND